MAEATTENAERSIGKKSVVWEDGTKRDPQSSLTSSLDEEKADREVKNDYDYLFKMLLVGDPSVGKSSLLLRFIDDVYTGDYATTIGVDFKTRTTNIGHTRVKLQIWDTAGHERFRAITSGYYRGAHGVIIVYDVTLRTTFEHIEYWLDEVNKFAPVEVSKLLIGNKCDLEEERQVAVDEAERYADELGINYVETSALSAHHVEEAFGFLTTDIQSRVIIRQSFQNAEAEANARDARERMPFVLGAATRVRVRRRDKCCGRA